MSVSQYKKSADLILKALPDRSKEVLQRRYGLSGSDQETLEEIGQDFGVTRERVRQIEQDALERVRGKHASLVNPIFNELENYLSDYGNVRAEHHIIDDFGGLAQAQHVIFFLDLGPVFQRVRENNYRHPVWFSDSQHFDKADFLMRAVESKLNQSEKDFADAEFWQLVEQEARRLKIDATDKALSSWIGASSIIMQSPLKTWGLSSWPHVNPHNVGDWAYLAMRVAEKPLHFTEIVGGINDLKEDLDGGNFSKDKAHLQTVHNELIKDDRFVIVGRGIYALSDWGYEKGTVKDVIAALLKKVRKPLTRTEILDGVSKTRFVQPNTIILNLHNKNYFKRLPDGRYVLKG